ncbi:MAG: alpha-N-arabinofuranosidase [Chloroflexi bacterium]|nr:alpha-N-arabinofuranosidase [Chloroflexota bacterium]
MMRSTIDVLLDEPIGTINRNLYGHFIEHLGRCIDDGLWVGEDSTIPNEHGIRLDVIRALQKIRPPLLRWPGGSFADDYHWQDGIGPRSERPRRVNIWWGNAIETNAFGTHEFMHLCRAIGAQPYLCGNVGNGTPRELREWVEYCNYPAGTTLSDSRIRNGAEHPFGVKYWAIGNESWHSGGSFNPEEYVTEYCRFSTFAREFGPDKLYLVACGPSGNDLSWTERFFTRLKDRIAPITLHAFSGHYYIGRAGTATGFSEDEWYDLLWQVRAIETLIVEQRALMDQFDPERKVHFVVDEWGALHPPEPGGSASILWQQSSLRDGLFAALVLNIFNRHAEKVTMANLAQAVNVVQALILTEEERMVVTPTYHVFDMYQSHQGAQSIRLVVDSPETDFSYGDEAKSIPALTGSASLRDGILTLTIVNTSLGEHCEATLRIHGAVAREMRETVLTHENIRAHNTFVDPDQVVPSAVRTMPVEGSAIVHTFGPRSVSKLQFALS